MAHIIELANQVFSEYGTPVQVIRLSEGLRGLTRETASAATFDAHGVRLLDTVVEGVWQVQPPMSEGTHHDLGRTMLKLVHGMRKPTHSATFSDRTRDVLPQVVTPGSKHQRPRYLVTSR